MENNYLIVCDLDGTLLDKNKQIPESTVNYLRKLNKDGYNIVFASGRPTNNIMYFYEKVGLKTPIISFNGLHVKFFDEHDDVKFHFDKDNILNVLKEIKKKIKIKNVFLSTENCIYSINKYESPKFWQQGMKSVCCPLEKILENKVMNFVIEPEDKKINKEEIRKILSQFKKNKVCFWEDKYEGFFEIYSLISNKYKAIMEISKKLKINPENIFAFGNDLNDIEFLMNLKNAYAMCNSKQEIKNKSHLITKFDNDNIGVERELKIILKNLK